MSMLLPSYSDGMDNEQRAYGLLLTLVKEIAMTTSLVFRILLECIIS